MRKLTKKQALEIFREDIAPYVREQYGRGDVIAMREAWNNWTDGLCKDGCITPHQYTTWTNPF